MRKRRLKRWVVPFVVFIVGLLLGLDIMYMNQNPEVHRAIVKEERGY